MNIFTLKDFSIADINQILDEAEEFKNGKKIEVKCSVGSINNQILRASRLESVMRARKK